LLIAAVFPMHIICLALPVCFSRLDDARSDCAAWRVCDDFEGVVLKKL